MLIMSGWWNKLVFVSSLFFCMLSKFLIRTKHINFLIRILHPVSQVRLMIKVLLLIWFLLGHDVIVWDVTVESGLYRLKGHKGRHHAVFHCFYGSEPAGYEVKCSSNSFGSSSFSGEFTVRVFTEGILLDSFTCFFTLHPSSGASFLFFSAFLSPRLPSQQYHGCFRVLYAAF